MRSLIIDRPARMAIDSVKKNALENTVSLEHMIFIAKGEMPPPGDSPEFTCEIREGYRVVYTIEEQPGATVKHISISVDKEGSLPSMDSVSAIMEAFGMGKLDQNKDVIWIEKYTDSRAAINVLQIISERQTGNA